MKSFRRIVCVCYARVQHKNAISRSSSCQSLLLFFVITFHRIELRNKFGKISYDENLWHRFPFSNRIYEKPIKSVIFNHFFSVQTDISRAICDYMQLKCKTNYHLAGDLFYLYYFELWKVERRRRKERNFKKKHSLVDIRRCNQKQSID